MPIRTTGVAMACRQPLQAHGHAGDPGETPVCLDMNESYLDLFPSLQSGTKVVLLVWAIVPLANRAHTWFIREDQNRGQQIFCM